MEYKYHEYRTKTNRKHKKIPAEKIINWIENNFDYKTRKNNTEYCICDPFTGDAKYKFNINPENGVCHSWHGDDWAGPINPKSGKRNCSIINFIKVYKRCSYKEALKEVLGDVDDIGTYLTNNESKKKEYDILSVILPDGVEPLSNSKDMQAKALIKWLITRGYSNESIYKNEIFKILQLTCFWVVFHI